MSLAALRPKDGEAARRADGEHADGATVSVLRFRV